MTNVLFAAQDIPAGVFIRPEMVTPTPVTARQADWEAVNDFQEIAGLTTLAPIRKGDPVFYNHLDPTAKAFGPTRSPNPQNYLFMVNEATGVGRLFKPGTNLYLFGKLSEKTPENPLAVFPRVDLAYQKSPTQKREIDVKNPLRVFGVTPDQEGALKNLDGQFLRLLLNEPGIDEILEISNLNPPIPVKISNRS